MVVQELTSLGGGLRSLSAFVIFVTMFMTTDLPSFKTSKSLIIWSFL